MPTVRCVAVIAVLMAGGASAQTIYRWTDAKGTVHYTDDASSIPRGAKVTTVALPPLRWDFGRKRA